MTVSTATPTKDPEKIPAAKCKMTQAKQKLASPVSPTAGNLQDEVLALRARNKILTDALKAVKEQADEQAKRNFELVWFARNRNRYPNHEASKRLEASEEHREELQKLRGADGDYFHGLHSGILAASKMFQQHADILHINDHDDYSESLQIEANKHAKKIVKSQESFPDLDVTKFPEE